MPNKHGRLQEVLKNFSSIAVTDTCLHTSEHVEGGSGEVVLQLLSIGLTDSGVIWGKVNVHAKLGLFGDTFAKSHSKFHITDMKNGGRGGLKVAAIKNIDFFSPLECILHVWKSRSLLGIGQFVGIKTALIMLEPITCISPSPFETTLA